MADWTSNLVETRLAEAADVLDRLPEDRVQGYSSTWPAVVHDFADLVAQEAVRLRRPPPSSASISRMDETLGWLSWLEPADAKLVWLRASGERWKAVCWKLGMSRATAHRHWLYALSVIAWRLNERSAPAGQSLGMTTQEGTRDRNSHRPSRPP